MEGTGSIENDDPICFTGHGETMVDKDEVTYLGPLVALSSLYFIFGFITCLNDILVPHLKVVFELNYARAMFIQLSFFSAYFIVSLPSGWLVDRLGYQNLESFIRMFEKIMKASPMQYRHKNQKKNLKKPAPNP